MWRRVKLSLNAALAAIEKRDKELVARLENGETLAADFIISAAGARPETELAAAAGVKLGASGAIAVNERQETNLAEVYAAGACCEGRHRVSGRDVWIPLAVTASRQGRVAGANAAGGSETFHGLLGTGVVQVFDHPGDIGKVRAQFKSDGNGNLFLYLAQHIQVQFLDVRAAQGHAGREEIEIQLQSVRACLLNFF